MFEKLEAKTNSEVKAFVRGSCYWLKHSNKDNFDVQQDLEYARGYFKALFDTHIITKSEYEFLLKLSLQIVHGRRARIHYE